MKQTISYISLIIILLVGFFLRFHKLGDVPKGLYIDEAGQGYSAYSILLTGKDEFGFSFPMAFRSFTDFKTPVYIYLIAPLINIFGLTAFTVRFPSFFFSMLTFPVLYLLVRKLTADPFKKLLPLLTLGVLSISPWHILFARTNFECNVALFFLILAIYLFYKSLDNYKFFPLSTIFFAIALPSYHSQRIVAPLVALFLVIRHKNIIFKKQNLKITFLGIILGILITIPTIQIMTTPGFLARANGLNILSHSRQMPAGYLDFYKGILTPLVNGSWYLTTQEFLGLYSSYLSPRFMFILGDYGPRSSFPELSTFFIWQFAFYVLGLIFLIKTKKLGEIKFLILLLLLVGPIPAALTRDPYSSIRSLQLVIPQNIIIALGILTALQKFKFKILGIFITAILFVYSIGKIYSSVFLLNEYYRAHEWDYGWEEVTQNIKHLDRSLPVVVDNSREEAYIELLFFLKFDPKYYQKTNFIDPNIYYTNMEHKTTHQIGNITTRPINWEKDTKVKQYLIGDSLSISDTQMKEHNLNLIKNIYYPDQSIAFKIVVTNPSTLK